MGGFLSTFAFLEKKRQQIQEKALGIPSRVTHEGKCYTAELQEQYVVEVNITGDIKVYWENS